MIMFNIYTRENCTYCTQAKALLERKGLEYIEIPLTSDNVNEFTKLTNNAKTVPQIFYIEGVNTTHIGGYDKLVPFVEAWWPNK